MSQRIIQIDPDQLRDLELTLRAVPKGVAKVISRATNKVATSNRKEISDEVRKRLNIKAGELKSRNVTLKRASYTNGAIISIKGGRIPLIKLGANQTKRGVTYKIAKVGPRKLAEKAFVSTMTSGHRGVFKRINNSADESLKGTGAYVHHKNPAYDPEKSNRNPVIELKGPSVPQVFQDIAMFAKAIHERSIAADLEREIAVQVEVLLEQHRVS